MIKLRFTREQGMQAAIIRAYTWFDFDHVEIALPNSYLGSRTQGGVQRRRLDYNKPIDERFSTIGCSEIVTRRALDFIKNQIGKPYDWSGITGIQHHWARRDSWICSELIAAAFDYAQFPLVNGDPIYRITPRDIAMSPHVRF